MEDIMASITSVIKTSIPGVPYSNLESRVTMEGDNVNRVQLETIGLAIATHQDTLRALVAIGMTPEDLLESNVSILQALADIGVNRADDNPLDLFKEVGKDNEG
jgi:hypothetical protein